MTRPGQQIYSAAVIDAVLTRRRASERFDVIASSLRLTERQARYVWFHYGDGETIGYKFRRFVHEAEHDPVMVRRLLEGEALPLKVGRTYTPDAIEAVRRLAERGHSDTEIRRWLHGFRAKTADAVTAMRLRYGVPPGHLKCSAVHRQGA